MSQYGTTFSATKRTRNLNVLAFLPFLWNKTSRFSNVNKCITSKAGILVLFWTFMDCHMYYLLNRSLNWEINSLLKYNKVVIVHYSVKAFVFFFFPIAGILADNRFGRLRTVIFGLTLMTVSFVLISVLQIVLKRDSLPSRIFIALVCLFSLVGFICVNANLILVGVDQLHDSPTEHQSLFIHWHVWFWYLGSFIAKLETKVPPFKSNYFYLIFNSVVAVLLILSMILTHFKKIWFLQDSPQFNPYWLVLKVTRFARQHKVPIRRSAFTYCEEDIPTGLDLGKAKYGGPFTTEQVEDVKVFFGILKVLLVLGPSFTLEIASSYSFPFSHQFKHNVSKTTTTLLKLYILEYGFLNKLMVVLCIPIYIFILRPFLIYRIPRTLTRLGLGFTFQLFSILINFVMVVLFQFKYGAHFSCKAHNFNSSDIFTATSTETLIQDYVLGFQGLLNAVSIMLTHIALYEFICSQSPHSMKGLLLGLSFAFQGLFQLVGTIIISPFYYLPNQHLFQCWIYYFVINIVIGFVGLSVFMKVARNYKLRERDEPYLIYRYAEDYYSKIQD